MHLRRQPIPRVLSEEVLDLLALAVWPATRERAANVYQSTYAASGSVLYTHQEKGDVDGVLGVRRTGPSAAEILHIAVAPSQRQKGIGRSMVEDLLAMEGLRDLVAETDSEAVGFYRRCGFIVRSLGEKYPGVERFLCTLSSRT